MCFRRAMRFAISAPNSFRTIDNNDRSQPHVALLTDHQEPPETLTGITGVTFTEAKALEQNIVNDGARVLICPGHFVNQCFKTLRGRMCCFHWSSHLVEYRACLIQGDHVSLRMSV